MRSNEDIDSYCRRRARTARSVCTSAGLWSELWIERVLNWQEHVMRGTAYGHICENLLKFRDEQWLRVQRSAFVAINSASWAEVRCHVDRGRTGTRLNIGRPQMRWHQGCELARAVKQENKGREKVSIGTAIFNVLSNLRLAFDYEGHNAGVLYIFE